jgi:hypothetical protein
MIKNPFARDFADLFFGFRGFHVHHESSGSCPPAVGRLEKASKDCWKEVGSWRTFNIVWNIRRYRVSIECWYLYIYISHTHIYIYLYLSIYNIYIDIVIRLQAAKQWSASGLRARLRDPSGWSDREKVRAHASAAMCQGPRGLRGFVLAGKNWETYWNDQQPDQ